MKPLRDPSVRFTRGPTTEENGRGFKPRIGKAVALAQRMLDAVKQPGGLFHKRMGNSLIRTYLADTNGPNPLRIVKVTTGPKDTFVFLSDEIFVESGLFLELFWSNQPSPGVPQRGVVTVSKESASYFRKGSAADLSGAVLQGSVKLITRINTRTGATDAAWTRLDSFDTTRAVSEGWYPSQATDAKLDAWHINPVLRPHKWTGFGRFVMQCLGPHKHPVELRPDGWPTVDPRYYAFFRTEAPLQYWMVYCGPAGIKVARLPHNPAIPGLVNLFGSGKTWGGEDGTIRSDLPAIDIMAREAAVIATLTKPTDPNDIWDEIEPPLGDGSALDAVYGDPITHTPWRFSWHWSPQKVGTASQKRTDGVIVVRDFVDDILGDEYFDIRYATATFTFPSPNDDHDLAPPTVSIGVQQNDVSIGSAGLKLWWIWDDLDSYTTVIQYSTPPNVQRNAPTNGVLYALYPDSGPEFYQYSGTYTATSRPEPEWWEYDKLCYMAGGCGSVSGMSWTGPNGDTVYRSYDIGFPGTPQCESGIGTDYAITSDGSLTASGGSDSGYFQNCAYNAYITLGGVGGVPCGPAFGPSDCPGCPITITYDTLYCERTVHEYGVFDLPQFNEGALILTQDPTVLYLVYRAKDYRHRYVAATATYGGQGSPDIHGPMSQGWGYNLAGIGSYDPFPSGGFGGYNVYSGVHCPVLSSPQYFSTGVWDPSLSGPTIDYNDPDQYWDTYFAVLHNNQVYEWDDPYWDPGTDPWGGSIPWFWDGDTDPETGERIYIEMPGSIFEYDEGEFDGSYASFRRIIWGPDAREYDDPSQIYWAYGAPGPFAMASYGGTILFQDHSLTEIHWDYTGMKCRGPNSQYNHRALWSATGYERPHFMGAT